MVKEYRLNNDYGLRCISGEGNYVIEVFCIGLPFAYDLERVVCKNANDANKEFKRLAQKYKFDSRSVLIDG